MFSLSHDLANADIDFCYDQVGDDQYCFEKKEKCEIASKDDSMEQKVLAIKKANLRSRFTVRRNTFRASLMFEF